jgi:hypothetical protein
LALPVNTTVSESMGKLRKNQCRPGDDQSDQGAAQCVL